MKGELLTTHDCQKREDSPFWGMRLCIDYTEKSAQPEIIYVETTKMEPTSCIDVFVNKNKLCICLIMCMCRY